MGEARQRGTPEERKLTARQREEKLDEQKLLLSKVLFETQLLKMRAQREKTVLGWIGWRLRQLLPLTYRNRWYDAWGFPHFSIWRMWFGHVFAVDDFQVVSARRE